MRLTTVILIASLLQVSAAGFAQKITLNQRNTTLESILKEIRKQSGYDYYYDSKVISKDQKASISVKEASIEEALEKVLEGSSLTYEIDGKIISIKKKEPSFLENIMPRLLNVDVRGKVTDEQGTALAGATVIVKNGRKVTATRTDAKGQFFIANVDVNATLVVTYIGYKALEISLKDAVMPLEIKLNTTTGELEEVAVASNGYQDIPKERSTGSFEVITAKMLEHSSSPNLLRRLEGLSTSIVFNTTQSPVNSGSTALTLGSIPGVPRAASGRDYDYNGGYAVENMTIRGRNSLASNASAAPLVVIDGIANAYDINLLNPDDLESITILKDAASASIWGSKAANGVLVIKTKRGKINQPLNVTFNTNLSVGEKLDLFYMKRMSTSDFIDMEIYRFNQLYNQSSPGLPVPVATAESNPALYTPVQEILDAMKKGSISTTVGNAQIDALRGNDFRNDQQKYLLQNPVIQNYSLNLNGGSSKIAYTLSGGYSRTKNNTVNNGSDRISMAYNMQLNLIKDLSLNAGVNYSTNRTWGLGTLFLTPPTGDITRYSPAYMPYTRFADNAGNPLQVALHRPGFLQALSDKYGNKILDNSYYPLNDLNESYKKGGKQNLGLTADLRYRVNELLSASLTYNYNFGPSSTEQFYSGDSYYMRDLINQFTNPTTQARVIPLGGLLMPTSTKSHNQTIRGLVFFNKSWNKKNELSASAGLDIAESSALTQPSTGYYGYDRNTLQARPANVTFVFNHPRLYNATATAIPNGPTGQFLKAISRTVGQFFNIGYTYDSRYTLTGSVRKDGNNAFGNKTNRTGTPFYHLGAGWNIMNEPFYELEWLPSLKLRYTFGYNGNTNPGPTAEPQITLWSNAALSLLPFAQVATLSNAKLRPERTGIHNLGLDFGFKGGRITGSAEYYLKTTTDLIATGGIDPFLGFSTQTYNVASLRGDGIDVGLNSVNLQSGKFSWGSNVNLSYNRVKITKSFVASNAQPFAMFGAGGIYPEGSNLSTLYAFEWAGLDPATGAPRVIYNGVPSIQNQSIYPLLLNSISSLKEVGSSVPVYYGNLGNTIQYSGFAINFNIMYKLGYYQRRPSNTLFLNSSDSGFGAEYARRWQQPGDELKTNVPSLDYARSVNDFGSESLYVYADINTYRADHIRLQEVNLSYSPGRKMGLLKGVRVYVNMPLNIMLWRANKLGLDPDIYDYPVPRTYTFGFSTQF